MTLTIYINKELAEQMNTLSKALNRSRNSIIHEAIERWIKEQTEKPWPDNFFDFEAVLDVPDFKATRKELKEPPLDPFAEDDNK